MSLKISAASQLLCSAALFMLATAHAATNALIELSPQAAAPARLQFGSQAVPVVLGRGGFTLHDFNAKRDLPLPAGKVTVDAGVTKFTTESDEMAITATFTPKDGYILVTGVLENRKPGDRAIILRYTLPLPLQEAFFSESLADPVALTETSNELGTVYPIAAMTGKDWGASISIPPNFPSCFGVTGNRDGLSLEFYFGLTADTKGFPNRAPFTFILDAAQPGWGFRSALAGYYRHFPEYYKPRYKGAGFWNWNDPAGLDDPKSIVNEALPLFKVHGLTRGANYSKQAERDVRHGVTPFAYTIVGMREILQLPEMPADYDEAMRIFGQFEKDWQVEGPDGELHKKYFGATERNQELPAQIRSSTMFDAEGKYRLRLRHSVWGANSITFIENPNPALFHGQGIDTVGSVTLKMVERWFGEKDVLGLHMDSLGSQWPSWINYRRDHFADAQYPLTFDKEGRIGLHNMISHYEFLEALRKLAVAKDKLVFGNGLDIYERRNQDEHYNSRENGRFFHGAMLDMAGREITDDQLSRARLEAYRVVMGPKLMTAILYKWQDQGPVIERMNRSLALGVFTAPNRFFEDKISYLAAENGFKRDRELLEWFGANARLLHNAGWQPVTHGRVNSPEIIVERFGTGDVVYYTLCNFGGTEADAELVIDLAALGLAPADGISSSIKEIARNAKITAVTEGVSGTVRLRLKPNETHIIKLTRTW
jgi:hypothetical protein